MMFYVYTIVVPVLMLLINYSLIKPKPKVLIEYVGLLLKTAPYLFGYAFFLYFLEKENYINTSWTFYTVLFFSIPITLIALLIKIIYWIKKKKPDTL